MKKDIKDTLLFTILVVIGLLIILNFVYLLIFQIKTSDLQVANIAALVLTQILLVAVTVWTAYSSPSAVLAKIEKSRHIRELRIAHYANLEFHVIRPLSQIYPESSEQDLLRDLKLHYNISKIKENPSFDDAIRHLNLSYPDFSQNFKLLITEVERLNQDVDNFIAEIESNVRNDISQKGIKISDKLPVEPGTVQFYMVFITIRDRWKNVIHTCRTERKFDDSTLNLEISKTPSVEYVKKGDEMWISGHWIAKLIDETQEKEMVKIITKYSSNVNFFKQIISMMEKKSTLIQKSKAIHEQCEKLADFIKTEKYHSITDCCEISRLLSESDSD